MNVQQTQANGGAPIPTDRAALTEAIERVEHSLRIAENALDGASDELYRLRTLIGLNAVELDGPDPVKERVALAEWNQMAGRTEATA